MKKNAAVNTERATERFAVFLAGEMRQEEMTQGCREVIIRQQKTAKSGGVCIGMGWTDRSVFGSFRAILMRLFEISRGRFSRKTTAPVQLPDIADVKRQLLMIR